MNCIACSLPTIGPTIPPYGGFLCKNNHLQCQKCTTSRDGLCALCNGFTNYICIRFDQREETEDTAHAITETETTFVVHKQRNFPDIQGLENRQQINIQRRIQNNPFSPMTTSQPSVNNPIFVTKTIAEGSSLITGQGPSGCDVSNLLPGTPAEQSFSTTIQHNDEEYDHDRKQRLLSYLRIKPNTIENINYQKNPGHCIAQVQQQHNQEIHYKYEQQHNHQLHHQHGKNKSQGHHNIHQRRQHLPHLQNQHHSHQLNYQNQNPNDHHHPLHHQNEGDHQFYEQHEQLNHQQHTGQQIEQAHHNHGHFQYPEHQVQKQISYPCQHGQNSANPNNGFHGHQNHTHKASYSISKQNYNQQCSNFCTDNNQAEQFVNECQEGNGRKCVNYPFCLCRSSEVSKEALNTKKFIRVHNETPQNEKNVEDVYDEQNVHNKNETSSGIDESESNKVDTKENEDDNEPAQFNSTTNNNESGNSEESTYRENEIHIIDTCINDPEDLIMRATGITEAELKATLDPEKLSYSTMDIRLQRVLDTLREDSLEVALNIQRVLVSAKKLSPLPGNFHKLPLEKQRELHFKRNVNVKDTRTVAMEFIAMELNNSYRAFYNPPKNSLPFSMSSITEATNDDSEHDEEEDNEPIYEEKIKKIKPEPSPQYMLVASKKPYNPLMLAKMYYIKLKPIPSWRVQILRSPINCPDSSCNRTIFVSDFVKHLIIDHNKLPLERISPHQCKNFFIDPRLTRIGATKCSALYLVRKIISNLGSSRYRNYLPVMVMSSRIKLTDMCNIDIVQYPAAQSYIEFFLIWLTGIKPEEYDVATTLTVWSRSGAAPVCHVTNTGNLYSIRDSQNVQRVWKSGNCILLSSEQIRLLTSNGNDLIELQIVIH